MDKIVHSREYMMNISYLYSVDHYLANRLNHQEIQKVSQIDLIGFFNPKRSAPNLPYDCINIVHIFLIPIMGLTHS